MFTDIFLPQWRKNHPNYKIIIWTENEISQAIFLKPNELLLILDQSLNPALRADILRILILARFSGINIYSDVDMSCEQSLDTLLDRFD